MKHEERGQWKSRVGFVLAASGSAIGLGNIVFFGANAYKYGGGAFYFPYFIALFVVGIPVLLLEFGIGHYSRKAFPDTMRTIAGKPGEFIGWWALCNSCIIMMYYITLLAWVLGMLVGSFGPLWEKTLTTPAYAPESLKNPDAYFFNTLASPWVLGLVAVVWAANVLICIRGTRTIEAAVKLFLPAMWIMMIVLIIRGVTLPNGFDGVLYLFTPDFRVMQEYEVWQGAFTQIFFSLSLGFGLLSAYASYLPKKSDTTSYGIQTALMNCSFEYIAGFAMFSMLFAFAIVPKASTLSMSFFVLPAGIRELPAGVGIFGVLFFLLLLFAGLSSSISLVEGIASAVIDKFRVKRWVVLTVLFVVGFGGSAAFALPKVIDPGLNQNGTLGLTLLDLFDNKAFGYGLLIVGLAECILVGWVFGAKRLADHVNRYARIKLGIGFQVLIQFVIPVAILTLLVLSGLDEAGVFDEAKSFPYGQELVDPAQIGTGDWKWLATAVPVIWVAFTIGIALLLALVPGREEKA